MMERDIRAFLQAITESANYSVIHKVLHPLVMNRNSQSKIFSIICIIITILDIWISKRAYINLKK